MIIVTYTDLRSITNQAAYGKPNEKLTFFLNSVIVDLNNSYKWNCWNQPQQKNITWGKRFLDIKSLIIMYSCALLWELALPKNGLFGKPYTTSISFHRSVGGNRSPGTSLIEMQVLFNLPCLHHVIGITATKAREGLCMFVIHCLNNANLKCIR